MVHLCFNNVKPVAVLEALFGVVAGGIAVVGFDEGLHFLVFLSPEFVLGHMGGGGGQGNH